MSRKMHFLRSMPHIWNYLKYRTHPRKPTMLTRRYTPQIASLLVTLRCNLSCVFCSMGKELNPKGWREKEATLEKIQRIFANPLFSNCLGVDMVGGEPMLVKELVSIVSWLSKRGHLVNMNTNGLRLDEHIDELKRAGIARISISLYDENQSFLEKNLSKINKIFPVDTSIVLERKTVENEQEKFLEKARFIHDAGCRSLNVMIYRPMGINPLPEEIITETLPAYIELKRKMDKTLPNFCSWPTAIQTGKIKKRCPQPWQRVTTDMLGKVYVCCGSELTLKGPNSNLFDCEDKPDDLFNHPTLVSVRKQLLDPLSGPPNMCKDCSLLGEPGW